MEKDALLVNAIAMGQDLLLAIKLQESASVYLALEETNATNVFLNTLTSYQVLAVSYVAVILSDPCRENAMFILDSASVSLELREHDVTSVCQTTGAILQKDASHVIATSTALCLPSVIYILVIVSAETALWECDAISAKKTTSTTAETMSVPNAPPATILSRTTSIAIEPSLDNWIDLLARLSTILTDSWTIKNSNMP